MNINGNGNKNIFININLIFFFIIIIRYNNNNNNNPINNNKFNLLNENTFFNYENKDIINIEYFRLLDIEYTFSFKFNIVKLQYNVGFYDNNKNLILPSYLTLYNKLHIICYYEESNYNTIINSIPNIYQNKFFNCIELLNINLNAKLGILIYQYNPNIKHSKFFLFDQTIINFKNLSCYNDNIFSSFYINHKYKSLVNKFNEKKINESLKFQKSYILYPYSTLKQNVIKYENKWYYSNIYNHYFCYCKGEKCFDNNIDKRCKYYFYLYIINNNRDIYLKTDYLFIDFIFAELSSDDVYPIFEKMDLQNFPVHYITEHLDIYNKYCFQNKTCLKIIFVDKNNYTMDGDFLENYLNLFLKLKVVVSGRAQGFNYLTNLFYNLEYISYIGVGHGVSFFKYFLYSDYETYGRKQNDKILIPPSQKLISIANKYGWEKKNIINMNLPKWDKYNYYKNIFINRIESIRNNSIFIMFTWRDTKRNKMISSHYFKNILSIIENNELYQELVNKNIILYFAFHHLTNRYINKYINKNTTKKYIHMINSNEISECLLKTNLLITDFSSIIFDFIYQRKPFIIYIPDANDELIKSIYKNKYFELIQSLKNDTIYFENKYFEVNKTINKILYYINNNFKLDYILEKFYDSFNFKRENYTNKFINYIINL